GAEQLAAECRAEKALARAASTVEDEDRVAHDAGGVALRSPDRPVMELQHGKGFAGPAFEIARRIVALDRRWKGAAGLSASRCSGEQRQHEPGGDSAISHAFSPAHDKRDRLLLRCHNYGRRRTGKNRMFYSLFRPRVVVITVAVCALASAVT